MNVVVVNECCWFMNIVLCVVFNGDINLVIGGDGCGIIRWGWCSGEVFIIMGVLGVVDIDKLLWVGIMCELVCFCFFLYIKLDFFVNYILMLMCWWVFYNNDSIYIEKYFDRKGGDVGCFVDFSVIFWIFFSFYIF